MHRFVADGVGGCVGDVGHAPHASVGGAAMPAGRSASLGVLARPRACAGTVVPVA
jgi:hypothetical protein